jgi:hypothetical protein
MPKGVEGTGLRTIRRPLPHGPLRRSDSTAKSLRLPAAAGSNLPAAQTPPEGLLDVHTAAAILAVKPATLYQWAYQRRIPVVKLFGARGALRFRVSDLNAPIERSLRPALRTEPTGAETGALEPHGSRRS